jgi:hypothetical protein
VGAVKPKQTPTTDDDAGAPLPVQAPVFSTSEPLEVSIELADADWEKLRREGIGLPYAAANCTDPTFTDYTNFMGKVTVNGQSLSNVETHKKGYLGSLSVLRPSFALDFGSDDAGKDRSLLGFKRLTLNNDRQDKTNARQCLAYELFERAGVRAPHCGLAHVKVNGNDVGYYTNVEPIKKPFLKRAFAESDGNLYELDSPTDFTAGLKSKFELKTKTAKPDTSDLDRLFEALQKPDDQLIAALEPLLALDEYLSLWAMEALLGQWDGMSGNGNNSFLYHSQKDGRFHPIPWGSDASFGTTHNLFPTDTAVSVFTSTQISKRLYALPEWRTKYQERMRKLLAEVWKEDELVAKLHAIADKTAAPAASVSGVEKFIMAQRGIVQGELDASEPPRPLTVLRDETSCAPLTDARSEMAFTWNAEKKSLSNPDLFALLGAFQGVQGLAVDMDIVVSGTPVELLPLAQLGVAGVTTDDTVVLGVTGVDQRSLETVIVGVIMPLAHYHPGTIEFHGFETFGVVASTSASSAKGKGVIGAGSIRFDEAGPNTGDAVRGEWKGKLAPMPLRAAAP